MPPREEPGRRVSADAGSAEEHCPLSARSQPPTQASRRVARLDRRLCAAAPDAPDELLGADGRPRAHWLALPRHRSPHSARSTSSSASPRPTAASTTWAFPIAFTAKRKERSWPLSRLPLLIPEAEWREIAAGVAQRAELLDQILPTSTARRDWSRRAPCRPRPSRARRTSSADVRRHAARRTLASLLRRRYRPRPRRRWWVLGDRAQAPSGAGYALENRLVLSRAFPSLYRDMNVERLAPFFREFRASISERRATHRSAHLPADARPLERDLFRTGLSRPLSRLPAGRGRRSRDERRQAACAHHRRLEARRCDVAARRRRLVRSAGAERRVAPRRRRACSRRSAAAPSPSPTCPAPASSNRAR